MFQLCCTVRNCSELLNLREGGLSCPAGHQFDRAKEGYWNLLQPQDKRSKNPGDSDAAVLARHRWLKRGNADGLINSMEPWIESTKTETKRSTRILDLGCGEGSFGPALFSGNAEHFCGIDMSKRAIKLAAKSWPNATWVLANADRILPIEDESVNLVISLFGRRPAAEINRVLIPDGTCIVAIPGEEDLIELREHVQQTGIRRSRWELVVEELTNAGLEFVEHQHWQQTMDLDQEAIADALAMTYRGVRHSQQIRAASIMEMNVTLAADKILFRRPILEM